MEGKWRTNLVYLFGILIAAGAFYCVWAFLVESIDGNGESASLFFAVAVFSAAIGALASWIIYSETIRKVPTRSLLMDKHGNPLANFLDGAFLWSWDKRLKGTKIVSYAKQEITARAGVRTHSGVIINLSVVLETVESPKALMERKRAIADLAKHAMVAREDDWLKYHLYRFIAESGEALKALNNPYDQEQQRKFDLLMHSYLDPGIKGTGMVIKEVCFF